MGTPVNEYPEVVCCTLRFSKEQLRVLNAGGVLHQVVLRCLEHGLFLYYEEVRGLSLLIVNGVLPWLASQFLQPYSCLICGRSRLIPSSRDIGLLLNNLSSHMTIWQIHSAISFYSTPFIDY